MAKMWKKQAEEASNDVENAADDGLQSFYDLSLQMV